MRRNLKIRLILTGILSVLMLFSATVACAEISLKGLDRQAFNYANQCRDEVLSSFDHLLKSGKLTAGQLFDTFYIPIPNTYPQKYHTQYDKLLDITLQSILDNNLKKSSHFIYFIVTDVNGYLPTHNSKFSQPLTGNKNADAQKNRTKIIYNDRTGLAAARNTSPYLLQEYPRDTGELIYDLSIPLYVQDKHWGCVRVGFTK